MNLKEWKPLVWNGSGLKTARERRGYSQDEVMRRLGELGLHYSQPNYSNWENRGIEPRGYLVVRGLMFVLGCEITELYCAPQESSAPPSAVQKS